MKVCVSVDMDTYREYRSLVDPDGDDEDFSFYDDAIPRFLDLFDECGMRATFFMIGCDAERPSNRARIREIAARGHEIANHSQTHPYNFRSLGREQKIVEIERADAAIADLVGERPVGFRVPSLELDCETLELLEERGYLYDSSVFPSPIMWAFMLYGKLFLKHADYRLGALKTPLAPTRPYYPDREKLHRRDPAPAASRILEIPVSVVPGLRVPFYATLLRRLGSRAFDLCLASFGRRQEVLVYILHLLDLVRFDDSLLQDAIARNPGLALPFERRSAFTRHAMQRFAASGEAVPIRDFVRGFRSARGLD